MPIHVLIVDDDPMVLQVNRAYVESLDGFRVVGTARNGREALTQTDRLRPDLVLLDIYMPETDGIAMLRQLRSQSVPADVIVISAAQDAETIQEIRRYGAVAYLIKPFRMERLKAALQTYRNARQQFQSGAQLNQDQLDQMFRAPALANPSDEPPKGMNESTLRQILTCLASQPEPMTAAEVAETLGMARVTARRYLEYLEKLGKLQVIIQYGGVGRPLNRYKLGE